jgi:hypothetical protein
MTEERVVIPRSKTAPAAREEVDLARLLKAVQTMDANAHDRMRELKLFLFFLPLIWGVVWGLLWLVVLMAMRS